MNTSRSNTMISANTEDCEVEIIQKNVYTMALGLGEVNV